MPTPPVTGLPVEAVLPELRRALAAGAAAVLEAPPGAGKTTLVPLHLLAEPWLAGRRILMLEPRRLAARAAAARMAELLGEPVGETVGYAMRFDRKVGRATRIEVVTEGLLTRYLQRDAGLAAYGAVIFDEFHERSLDADLGLALCLEVQETLRPDLRLLAMSATLDGAALAAHLGDAPLVRSDGRLFPVRVEHLGGDPTEPLELRVARAVELALGAVAGGVLVFLPGAREIRRAMELLAATVPGTPVFPLYGDLPRAAQDAAIRPGASAADRARDQHRRDQPDHRGDRRGGRQRARAAAALLGPYRDEPAGDRADRPLLGRAAQGAGRAPGARPVPAAVVSRGGSWACRPAPGRDRGGGPGAAGAGAGRLGRARPGQPALSLSAAGGAVRQCARTAASSWARSTPRVRSRHTGGPWPSCPSIRGWPTCC